MKTLISSKVLSAVLVAGALAAVGSVPASAQSLSHDGSLLPHYFDKNGELKWGEPAAQQAAPSTSHNLYLYAKPRAHRVHAN
jgi:hypothetical protein